MSVDPQRLSALTEQMRQLGLPEPEAAALHELENGTPVLATYSFLKWLTDEMIHPDDATWMNRARASEENNPLLGPALERLLGSGADPKDLNMVVRIMQYKICHHICYMLDQVAPSGYVPIQDFGLYQVGGGDSPETDEPIARLTLLHEQIEAWDPQLPQED